MPASKMKSVKRPAVYEALRKKRGMSKAKAARIANSKARKK
jgi:hypothetical protein